MENVIEYYQFKLLLESLENRAVQIRLRLMGESWTNFSKVILVSDNSLMYQVDMVKKVITGLRDVIEFEIDRPHLHWLPKTKYLLAG